MEGLFQLQELLEHVELLLQIRKFEQIQEECKNVKFKSFMELKSELDLYTEIYRRVEHPEGGFLEVES